MDDSLIKICMIYCNVHKLSILTSKTDYSLYILGPIILLQLNYTYPDTFFLRGLDS